MSRSPLLRRALALACGLALLLLALSGGPTLAATHLIYDDALAPGWSNWSWATVNLSATAPVHGGTHSIAVTYGAWQGLYLSHPGLNTVGYSRVRFFLHGGSAGGQQLNLYAERSSGGQGPLVALPPAVANSWIEVQVPLADLGATGATLTGLVWQDATGGSQPTLYVDDIALIGDETPDGPVLSDDWMRRSALPADGSSAAVVQVRASDPQGAGDIASVMVDASAIGQGLISLRDDGWSNDGAAGDGLFGGRLVASVGTARAEKSLVVTAEDQAGNRSTLPLGALAVLDAPPGGAVPAGLPARPAWGTNEWSETPGADWQVNSGVPWDYVYQYITYEWYTDGWGGNFVGRFVGQAWNKGYIPVVTVYLMLAVPPHCGEGAACYYQKLQNPATVSAYLEALEEAARQAQGAQPVLFHLEPDFMGFMQQMSNSPDAPGGVIQDDPTSFPVALNVAGYPNTLAGFGQRMVDLIHETAPNVLVAPHASMWAVNRDPNGVTPDLAESYAERTAAFLMAAGGAQADLLFVEWSDRDAGSGLRPWWDDTNHTLPHVGRAVLWENALSTAAGRRIILWQVPAGNMELDNSPQHYQDNRVAYAFRHARDLYEAGVIAVLFGAGQADMTHPSTDGGFIRAQGLIAYAPPAAPTGLVAGAVSGSTVPVRWNDNAEPDLWGYRVTYTPTSGGPSHTIDTRAANSTTLLLPSAGHWLITVAAYDAMGHLSPASAVVIVMIFSDAERLYLPLVQ